MSPTLKGIIATLLGFFSFFSVAIFATLHIRTGLVLGLSIPLFSSIVAFYLGKQARKGNSRALGMAGLFLGVFGILISLLNIFAVISSR